MNNILKNLLIHICRHQKMRLKIVTWVKHVPLQSNSARYLETELADNHYPKHSSCATHGHKMHPGLLISKRNVLSLFLSARSGRHSMYNDDLLFRGSFALTVTMPRSRLLVRATISAIPET